MGIGVGGLRLGVGSRRFLNVEVFRRRPVPEPSSLSSLAQ